MKRTWTKDLGIRVRAARRYSGPTVTRDFLPQYQLTEVSRWLGACNLLHCIQQCLQILYFHLFLLVFYTPAIRILLSLFKLRLPLVLLSLNSAQPLNKSTVYFSRREAYGQQTLLAECHPDWSPVVDCLEPSRLQRLVSFLSWRMRMRCQSKFYLGMGIGDRCVVGSTSRAGDQFPKTLNFDSDQISRRFKSRLRKVANSSLYQYL